jgi:hypothetical protein
MAWHRHVLRRLLTYRQASTLRSQASDKLLLPQQRHCTLPSHAAWYPLLSHVLTRSPRCSGKGTRTLRSDSPLFRPIEIWATPSEIPRIGSGSGTATTVSSCLRRRVIVDEQRPQSQKYSTRFDWHVRSSGSPSSRKSRPSSRYRNRAKQEGLLHLASITASHYFCAHRRASNATALAYRRCPDFGRVVLLRC